MMVMCCHVYLLALVLSTSQSSAQPVFRGVFTPDFPTSTHAPVFTAVNPPSCAQEVTDATKDITNAAVDIVYATSQCAYNAGWYGETPDGNRQQYPFHDGRGCAGLLIDTFASFAGVVGDLEAAAFDCFNNNQACGQAIAQSAQNIFEGMESLVSAADNCAPPGGYPPYLAADDEGYDVPTKGFFCWQDIVHFGQRMFKSSKFIDVAISQCDIAPPIPVGGAAAVPPTPTADNSTTSSGTPPTPTPDDSTSSAGSPPTPVADSSANSADSTSLGAPWGGLQQPERFEMIGQRMNTAALERRLSTAATMANGADVESRYERLKLARARMAGFLEAFGVDSTTAAEELREWDADEFEALAPLAEEVWEAFTDDQVAHDTAPILV